MKSLFTLLLFLLLKSGVAQNYLEFYDLINQAEWADYNKDEKKAMDLYYKALTRFDSRVDYYHYEDGIKLLLKNGEYKKASFLLQKSIRMFGYVHEENFNDTFWQIFIKNKYYRNYKNNSIKDKGVWTKNLNIDAISLYMFILTIDQYPRQYLWTRKVETILIKDSLKSKIENEMIDAADSVTKEVFVNYIKASAFPGYTQSGGKNNWHFFLAHTLSKTDDSAFFNYLNPILLSKIREGEVNPWEYALAMDYRNPDDGFCVAKAKNKSGEYYFKMSEKVDMRTIDAKRKSIGLPSVYQQSKIWKLKELPSGYQIPLEYR